MERRHDGDCQIFRGRVCTCGYLHRIKPFSDKWTELDEQEMVWQEYLTDLLWQMSDEILLPPPLTEEEIKKREEYFKKMWVEMGGRLSDSEE